MKAQQDEIGFPPFRFDPVNQQVWCDAQLVALRPKSIAVLSVLLAAAGRLVTRQELLRTVWPDATVSLAALKVCIGEIRHALSDTAATPQFIETLPRQGYRFIGLVQRQESSVQSLSPSAPTPYPLHPLPYFVSREAELQHLHAWLDQALRGERQMIFVTGEPGMGKTTVVEAFLAQLVAREDLCIMYGQCVELYGPGEAYLPVLAALEQACRTGGEQLIALLRQHAPSWLVQMPSLLSLPEHEQLQRELGGMTRERMLREATRAVEALTVKKGLVLVLEDLHWSDSSTLDFLSYLARQRQPARVFVLGTYRPAAVLDHDHPLKHITQELQLHGHCQELPLQPLTQDHIEEYLRARFNRALPPLQHLAQLIYARTEGNPLFMVNVTDYLLTQEESILHNGHSELQGDCVLPRSLPTTLQQMIERQLERLSPEERRVLEAASVAGVEFSTAAVAAGLAENIVAVERTCEQLARQQQFLQRVGTQQWPDGTVGTRYRFFHSVYQNVLYEQITTGRRIRLHQQIGERAEAGYGEQGTEIAAELAMHFERGRDHSRAIEYHRQAGEVALRRSAYLEALAHFTTGLQLLTKSPETPEYPQKELALQAALGSALIAVGGYTTPEVERAYNRARELCHQLGDPPQFFPVLWGQFIFFLVRGQLLTARELAVQLFRLAEQLQSATFLLPAHLAMGCTACGYGDLALAKTHLERASTLAATLRPRVLDILYWHDQEVMSLSYTALVLWSLGYADQAGEQIATARSLASELSHPLSQVFASCFSAFVSQFRQEARCTQERANETLTLASEQGFPHWAAFGAIWQGWALAKQGDRAKGIAQIQHGMQTLHTMGAGISRPHCLGLLAEAYGWGGQPKEGLSVLAEALATMEQTGERFYEAEVYRLKGTLVLQSAVCSPQSAEDSLASSVQSLELEAEEGFQKAIAITQRQQAKSLELRAATSLARLWQHQGKQSKARRMLAKIYNWFTERFDTADLKEAKALLDELS